MRILIVDDDGCLLATLARQFRHKGHQIWMASTLQQALEVVATEPIDSVLTDVQLGPEHGTSLAAKLAPTAVSCVLMTGDLSFELPAGLEVPVLYKPFSIDAAEVMLAPR